MPLHGAGIPGRSARTEPAQFWASKTIDVFYLHNPETQLSEVPAEEFRQRIRAAFTFLETAVAEKKIRTYGMATWNSFREDPKSAGYLSLEEMAGIAGGSRRSRTSFRFVQLPFNLAMPEALTRPNQMIDGKPVPMVQAARKLGISLITSAALLQGQLAKNLPPFVATALGSKGKLYSCSAICAFRSRTDHRAGRNEPSRSCEQNLSLVAVEPASREQFLKIVRIERLETRRFL